MDRKLRVVTAMVIGAVLAVAALMGGGRLLAETLASDAVPEYVNYQGYLTDSSGNPISGTVNLQFGIWDASTGGNQLWNETHANVPVSGGYFSVLLGSQGSAVTAEVFGGTARYLEVIYGSTTFPRQRFASVPYALVAHHAADAVNATYAITASYASNAGTADSANNAANATNAQNAVNAQNATNAQNADFATNAGTADSANNATNAINSTYAVTASYALSGPFGGGVATVDWQYVVVVAKSGGDYSTVTDAMNAISPSSTARYLVLVMPGLYEEQVTLKPYVHLKGAGVASTIISSQVNGNVNLPESATMDVPDNTQVSDLAVRNEAVVNDAVALRVSNGSSSTILNNVHAATTGAGGARHVGLYLNSGSPKLVHVYAEASGATTVFNAGIFNSASNPTIHDSTVSAAGFSAQGLRTNGGGPSITDSTISGLNGTDGNGIQTTGGSGNIYINRSSIMGDLTPQGESIISTDNSNFFVGASLLSGTVLVADPNRIQCAQSYDEFYAEIANVNTCQ